MIEGVMAFCRICAMLVFAVFFASATALAQSPLTAKNETGRAICEFHLSPAGSGQWASLVWGEPCLAPGRTGYLDLPRREGPHDLLIIFDDGLSQTYFGLEPSHYSHFILNETEAELLQWRP
ncbi:hypothetical protein LJB99_06710 [Deltaproteobacteria bacterium OttesenSCG-928-K17]|nr:hypothetical protein [Deltaproteobacteria bacterium OttesenSCG-928-K17]